MSLDPASCYRALQTRDPRFDGRFFTAVTSTGIYCRPICPAPLPRRENCRFLASAAAAQEAGFRPCLRCRPEVSPGTPAWLGTSATVSRALRLVSEGALDRAGVGDLSARLGIGERHLRRLFLEHLGATPVAVAQTRRLLFARHLLSETSLPMTEVALAAGFSSIRRFNDAFHKTYARTPGDLRRRRGSRRSAPTGGGITLRLAFRPPLDWAGLVGFLAPRAIPGVEEVGPDQYRRTVRWGEGHGVIEVHPVEGENHLLARLRLPTATGLIEVAERLRRIFDLGADPADIGAQLRGDRRMAKLLPATPGLRVPGAWDGFELAVRAILGQQVSVSAATRLSGRLARVYGETLDHEDAEGRGESLDIVFPEPATLVDADPVRLGIPRARAAAIASLARAVCRGELSLDASADLEKTTDQLLGLPGIGPWTAQYIAMRALGEPDAFPATDLGLRKALGSGQRLAKATEVARAAEAWRPWRAYAAMALWQSLGSGTAH